MRYLLLSAVALLALPAVAEAQGFVESLSPPAIERGKTTRVTFVGRDLSPAPGVWHSLAAGTIKAVPVEGRPDRIVFDVTVAADAPVGVCGVRVATRDGLTNTHLVLVDDLPVRPRGAGDSPESLTPPAAVWGTFREATVDRYRLDVKAGERVSFEVVGNRLGKDADPLLTIRDAAGRWVAERDNDPGLYFDMRFEHRFETAGTYTIDLRDSRYKASPHHHYVLRVGRFPAARVAVPAAVEVGFPGVVRLPEVPGAELPVAVPRTQPRSSFFATVKRPGDDGSTWVPITTTSGPVTVAEEFDEARDAAFAQATATPAMVGFFASPTRLNPFLSLDRHLVLGRHQATPAVVPGTLCGVLGKPGRADTFRLRLARGERIFVRAEAKGLNSPADVELAMIDRSGREVRRSGDTSREEANFDFTAPTTGDYGLIVRDVIRDGGDAFAYRVSVRHTPFPPQLTAEVEGLTVSQGSYQSIPILVARNGTAGPIKLHLIGAPLGVQLTPDEIGEKDNAVVCQLAADGSAPVGVHTIQIVAEMDGPTGPERVLVQTRPLIDKKLMNIDLIPIALRDDQVRLPPSLTDRFAVQVTPPAPFTFDLPEKEITLARYQKADIPIVTTRVAGFDGPIAFTATGGQLADKKEGRTRVYAEFPEATTTQPAVTGVVVSKILANIGKVRIDVSATGTHQGRRVTLTRAFDLDLTPAFKFGPEPAKVSLLPGESAKAQLVLNRVKTFNGPVVLHLQPMQGITLPETITVSKGQTRVEIAIAAAPDAQPRKQGIQVMATAEVDGFEEEVRGSPVEVEVKKVELPKK
ncbi:MAG: putative serine proteinase, subtilase family [Gemmataceae bacterium]|nr:putative serine proteinase, subtilase family [Gemmataceae bacterium]